jgi:hypothetical protein
MDLLTGADRAYLWPGRAPKEDARRLTAMLDGLVGLRRQQATYALTIPQLALSGRP